MHCREDCNGESAVASQKIAPARYTLGGHALDNGENAVYCAHPPVYKTILAAKQECNGENPVKRCFCLR